MIEATGNGDLCNIKIRIFQKPPARLQPVAVQEINGRLLEILLENDAAFTPADTGGSRDLLQSHGVPVMLVNVGNHFLLQA